MRIVINSKDLNFKKPLGIAQLKKKLTRVFNLYIRKRDFDFGCISCRKRVPWGAAWHAGHYYNRGSNYASLVYDEKNVNGQCCHCNTFLEGNKQGYRAGLIKKYGEGVLDHLDLKKKMRVIWTHFQYEVLIMHYEKLTK